MFLKLGLVFSKIFLSVSSHSTNKLVFYNVLSFYMNSEVKRLVLAREFRVSRRLVHTELRQVTKPSVTLVRI